jgi:hypothetical protein
MKVTSLEQAIALRKYDPATCLPDVSKMPAGLQKATTAATALMIICEATNMDDENSEPWEPNWNDDDEEKWWAWFDLEYDKENNPSGFRFFDADCDYTYSITTGGSRLCCRTRKDLEHIATTFENYFRDLMVIPKK